VGTRCANHVTPFYPQKLALTSPTGGGRSVGMVRSRTKATELVIISCIIPTILKQEKIEGTYVQSATAMDNSVGTHCHQRFVGIPVVLAAAAVQ